MITQRLVGLKMAAMLSAHSGLAKNHFKMLMIFNAPVPEAMSVQNLNLNWKKIFMMVWNCLVSVSLKRSR